MIKAKMIIALFLSSFFIVNAKLSVHLLDNNNNSKKLYQNRFLSDDDNHKSYFHTSESGRFEFEYKLTGKDAVSEEDANQNGVPDYIDSAEYYFEFVYDLYVNQLGFISPVKIDYFEDGEPYKVKFYETGDYYEFEENGETYTSPGGAYGFTISIEEILPKRKYERHYSAIHMDNNFSEYDSVLVGDRKYRTYYTFGMDAMKVTIAHEFMHSIHMMYGLDNPYSRAFLEMHSVLMEDYVFPEVNDYVQYVKALFRNLNTQYSSIATLTPDAGYRYSIFLMMLYEKYGINFSKRVMELTYDGNSNFAALDMSIKEENPESSISDEWCEFKDWIYYSGKGKMINPNKTFDDYEHFGMLSYINQSEFEAPVFMYSATLECFQINNIRLFFKKEGTISDDTLDVMLTNRNPSKLFNNSNEEQEYIFDVADYKAESGMTLLDEINYYFGIDKGEDICYTIFTGTGEKTESLSHSFPNPVNLNSDEHIYLPVPKIGSLYQEATYAIYDVNMNEISSDKSEIIPYEGKRVIRIDDLSRFSPGIYIFSVNYYDDNILGKIAVIRK